LVSVQAVKIDAILLDSAKQILAEGGQLLWFGSAERSQCEMDGFRLSRWAPLPGSAGGVAVLDGMFHVEQSD